MNEQDTQTIERVAKAINGPHDSSIIGIEELHKLQEYRWKRQTTKPERARCIYLARAAISAMPEATAQAATIKALVEALKPFSDKIIPDTLDPYGLPRPTVSGKCGDDAYRKAYDTLHALQMKGESDAMDA